MFYPTLRVISVVAKPFIENQFYLTCASIYSTPKGKKIICEAIHKKYGVCPL